MSLTQKDKEEIKKMIMEALEVSQDVAVELPDQYPDFESWKENLIETKVRGLAVAPEDFWVKTEKGTKHYFTWDEAKEYERTILVPNGFRLPTPAEWCILWGLYGVDENGYDDVESFMNELNLKMNGRVDEDDMKGYNEKLDNGGVNYIGSYGNYWSTGAYSELVARDLSFYSTVVNPQNSDRKGYGFSVRCVRSRGGK